jgi:hypothetical protein
MAECVPRHSHILIPWEGDMKFIQEKGGRSNFGNIGTGFLPNISLLLLLLLLLSDEL